MIEDLSIITLRIRDKGKNNSHDTLILCMGYTFSCASMNKDMSSWNFKPLYVVQRAMCCSVFRILPLKRCLYILCACNRNIGKVVQDVAIEQWSRNYVRILMYHGSKTGSLANCPSLSTKGQRKEIMGK